MEISNIIRILGKLTDSYDSITVQERAELHQFFKDESNQELLDQWFADKWNSVSEASLESEADLEAVLRNIDRKIFSDRDADIRKVRKGFLFYFSRVAAILFIPLVLSIALLTIDTQQRDSLGKVSTITSMPLSTSSQEYISPAGTRSKIVLPDGTMLWLNSASSVRINADFGKSNRDLYLSGEAYFDVVKNPDLKFIIQLDKAQVVVTGTTLSVRNYSDDKTIETTLLTGHANVIVNKKTTELTPSHTMIIDKDEVEATPIIETTKNEAPAKWKDGIIIFEQTPVKEAIRTLERWYNVEFCDAGKILDKQRITARFDNCSLSQILSYLSLSLQIECEYNETEQRVHIKPSER